MITNDVRCYKTKENVQHVHIALVGHTITTGGRNAVYKSVEKWRILQSQLMITVILIWTILFPTFLLPTFLIWTFCFELFWSVDICLPKFLPPSQCTTVSCQNTHGVTICLKNIKILKRRNYMFAALFKFCLTK